MCHSLAFDRLGGTVRTLRHGSPDAGGRRPARLLSRPAAPQRPAELGAGARSRPGDVARIAHRHPVARARAAPAPAPSGRSAASSRRGGACFDCHEVEPPPPGTLDFRIRPVAFPTRYLLHGWFDHRAHRICSAPASAARGVRGLRQLPPRRRLVRRGRPAAAGSRQLPHLPWRRAGAAHPVPSSCAMCHDYHMDEGTPAMLLRQRVRGRRWETTVIPVHPEPQPVAAGRR